MILGSGLGDFANNIKEPVHIAYKDIPNWNDGC
jgi:purine nucleoside phosphorylase